MGNRRRSGKLIRVLLWQVKFGSIAGKVEKQNPNAGFLIDKPILQEHLANVYEAFCSLNQAAEGSRIKASDIAAWLDLVCIEDKNARHDYFLLINAMDSAFAEYAKDLNANSERSNRRERRSERRSAV